MEGSPPNQPISRKELKRQRREARNQQQVGLDTIATRRGVIKILTPGGWIPEALSKGIGDLSRAGQASLAKDALLVTGGTAALFFSQNGEYEDTRPLKEKVLTFTWKDAENPEKLKKLVNSLATEYIEKTHTTRIQKNELMENTHFFKNREDYLKSVRTVEPNYNLNHAAYTHFKSKQVFVDYNTYKNGSEMSDADNAGIYFLDMLWHEWGHLDVAERTTGENINNQNYFFRTPQGNDEVYRRYRGAEIFTDSYFGYLTFEEVLNETITMRRIIEQVGVPLEGNYKKQVNSLSYYPNGISYFYPFARNIPQETLYTLHANSDFEGLAKLVGQYLPGNEPSFQKGERLFLALHHQNQREIMQTGVMQVIPPTPTSNPGG